MLSGGLKLRAPKLWKGNIRALSSRSPSVRMTVTGRRRISQVGVTEFDNFCFQRCIASRTVRMALIQLSRPDLVDDFLHR